MTLCPFLGAAPGGASSALKVPEGPSINIAAFYSPYFVWLLCLGSLKKASPVLQEAKCKWELGGMAVQALYQLQIKDRVKQSA